MNRKSIEGYEGLYDIDDQGNVYSLKFDKERILKPADNGNGYYQVNLCKDGKRKKHHIHRLVAEAFIKNPDNKLQVDHENGDRKDNRISNLRWVTHQQNCFNTKAKGCTFDKRAGKWRAQIIVDRKYIYLGYHDTEEEAHAAYLKAKEKYHIIE